MDENIISKAVYQEFGNALHSAYVSLASGQDAASIVNAFNLKALNAIFVLVAEINRDADFPDLTKDHLARVLSLITGKNYSPGNMRDEILNIFPSLRGEGDAA
ncbi:MAG: hypothetical protein ABF443_14090 [Acetobacter malorum]|uniref:hypothetical protein n=1 Tax=Acetobacter malorum TaxID=178901 RepID=UPI0039E7A219